jgi:hypothetical protein
MDFSFLNIELSFLQELLQPKQGVKPLAVTFKKQLSSLKNSRDISDLIAASIEGRARSFYEVQTIDGLCTIHLIVN